MATVEMPFNAYFAEYVRIKGLMNGDTWHGWEYNEWISIKHSKYRRLTGKQTYTTAEFTAWLKGESE